MNAVELYKKLPRKNCGKCRSKTCMPFAFSLMSGAAELSECPELTGTEIAELEKSVQKSNWREELVIKLQKEIMTIDFSQIAQGIGAVIQEGSLVIKYMGSDYSISPDGHISAQGRITPWTKILLLHYLRTRGNALLTGKWVSYRDLRSGMVKAASFLRECEDPLRALLDKGVDVIAGILRLLGAEAVGDSAAPHAWQMSLLPKVPVMILYWPQEDEFESKVSILFDSTADQFLDIESLMFLGEGLIESIETNEHAEGQRDD